MLKRKIMKQLIEWKNTPNKKCLIIRGARQVGKTFIVKEFGKEHYQHYVEINFYTNPEYKTIFQGSLNGEEIEKQIRLRVPAARNMETNKTLILIDEIQFCPEAITALKFLTIYGKYDIIATGSLLGLNHKDPDLEVVSYPVGYVTNLEMHSLDFEEFLWAEGVSEQQILDLKKHFDDNTMVHPSEHDFYMNEFKNYIVVGGMPEVVLDYIENKDYNRVTQIQKDIIQMYKDDIQKYAVGVEKNLARLCFESIPKHLSKDYKKFRYGYVIPKATSTSLAGSLEWLYDAGIINFCYKLDLLELPLEGNSSSRAFKVYMSDTGLLVAMLGEDTNIEILDGNLGIYKGAIYENIIADIFAKNGRKLYYFEHNSTIEMDFIIKYNRQLTAVEVKSSDNTKSKSMNNIMNKWKVKQGIKLSTKNVGEKENVRILPLYMAMFL